MADVSIKYNNVEIAALNSSGAKTCNTAGGICSHDIVVEYAKPEVQSPGSSTTLLGSGTYTLTGATATTVLNIPISISGTPRYVLVVADSIIPDIQQMYSWAAVYPTIPSFEQNGGFDPIYTSRGTSVTGSITSAASRGGCTIRDNNTLIVCSRDSSGYPVRDNTYNWYVWGDSE